MSHETTRVGKRGAITLPAKVRRRLGLRDGAVLIVEERVGGIFLRPAVAARGRLWTAEEKAGFLLNNSIGPNDYRAARVAVREMGVDPDKVEHEKPDMRRGPRRR